MNNSTWVFTGGEVTRNEAPELYSFRNYINLFEEYLRWQTAGNKTEKMERFVTNVGYKGQTLVDILETYEERIIPLKPNYLVYVLGIEEYNEYIFCDKKFQKMMESFVSVVSRDLDKNSEIIFFIPPCDLYRKKKEFRDIHNVLSNLLKKYRYTINETRLKLISIFDNKLLMHRKNPGETQIKFEQFIMTRTLIDELFNDDFQYKNKIDFSLEVNIVKDQKLAKSLFKKYSRSKNDINSFTSLIKKEKNLTWLFMGDSITQGAFWTFGHNSISQELSRYFNLSDVREKDIIINTAVSGATTESTIENFEKRLNMYKPDITSVMLGANDALNISVHEYRKNLETLIEKIKEKSKFILLRTPTPSYNKKLELKINEFVDVVYDIAEKDSEILLVDHFSIIRSLVQDNRKILDSEYNLFTDENKLHLGVNGQLLMFYSLLSELDLLSDRLLYFYDKEYNFSDFFEKFIEKIK